MVKPLLTALFTYQISKSDFLNQKSQGFDIYTIVSLFRTLLFLTFCTAWSFQLKSQESVENNAYKSYVFNIDLEHFDWNNIQPLLSPYLYDDYQYIYVGFDDAKKIFSLVSNKTLHLPAIVQHFKSFQIECTILSESVMQKADLVQGRNIMIHNKAAVANLGQNELKANTIEIDGIETVLIPKNYFERLSEEKKAKIINAGIPYILID